MLKLTHRIPHEPIKLAFSGGIDSLVMAHFLRRRNDVTLLHFHHGCEYSDAIEAGVRAQADALGLPLTVGYLREEKPERQSLEEFWRNHRYRFLYSESGSHVLTAHHLNDAVETWIWSSLHGEGKIISPRQTHHGQTLHRPFLLTPKNDIEEYARRHDLVAVDDPMNLDLDCMRNYIRHEMMPHVQHINPGIEKVIRKKYLEWQRNDRR